MAEIKTTELELVIGNDDPDAVAGPEILENFQKIDDAVAIDRVALAEKYSRPPTGIPGADLEQAVRDTLASVGAEPTDRDQAIADAITAARDDTVALLAEKLTRSTIPDVATASGTVAPHTFNRFDASAASLTAALPADPDDGAVVGVQAVAVGASKTVVVQCGGTNHIATPSGPTSYVLKTAGEGVVLQYAAGVWTIIAAPLQLAALDDRYLTDTDLLPEAFVGQTLWTYGHSYLAEGAGQVTSSASYYSNIINAALGTVKIKRAVGGTHPEQTVMDVTDGANKFVPATSGLVVIESLLNTARYNGGTTGSVNTAAVTSARNAMRAILALVTASSRIEQTDSSVFTYSSGWGTSTPTNAKVSGGSTTFHASQNAYTDITLPANPTGVYYLLTVCRETAGATIEVKDMTAGGTVLGTYDTSNGVVRPPASNTGTPTVQTLSEYAIRIEAPAGHVIRATKIDTGTVSVHIDALLPQSADPPVTVLVKEMYLPTYGASSNPDYNHGSNAILDAFNAILDTLAAEFPATVVADATSLWNPLTCIGPDNIHPNDTGYAALAQAVLDALRTYLGDNPAKVALEQLEADVQTSLAKADTAQQRIQTVNLVAAAGASSTLPDVATAQQHRLTLTAATCTLGFPALGAGKSFILALAQDATGSRLVTWPGTVKWPAGTAPTLSTGANKVDYFRFYCVDGTTWAGFTMGLDVR